jgi:MoaE-MoaD fusion protein
MADSPYLVKYAHTVIRVRLFAGLRERAGWSERELDGIERVSDVWPALRLGDEPAGLLYAVNREYAEQERELADGDEVALIPPVSGGAFRVTDQPLSLDAAVAEVADERAGAIATFTGTVRRQSRGREVTQLEYEAYAEMADSVLDDIRAEAERRFGVACAVVHRSGLVPIGEAAVAIVTAAQHRAEAYEANRFVIEAIKERLPIWKRERFVDGSEWKRPGA